MRMVPGSFSSWWMKAYPSSSRLIPEFKMDHMMHQDHQPTDPNAGDKMSGRHAGHDRHAGHSVAMFRDKFWLSFALTIPVVFCGVSVSAPGDGLSGGAGPMNIGAPAIWPYAYLIMSAVLLLVWFALYGARADLRRTMLRVSFGTALLGLTEPLFVPKYWNPYTLFDLARRTGFDLESLLFSFAIGGIVFAAYEEIFRMAPSESMADERHERLHRHHWRAIASPFLVFVILAGVTKLNPIYSSAIALVAGFFATLYCRRRICG